MHRTLSSTKIFWTFISISILLFFSTTLFHLWFVSRQLKEHVYLDASQTLSFVEMRFLAYRETLSLLKDPPPYLKNPAWLVDEFQSQPFLYGVLIWNREHIILNSFPHALLPDKEILSLANKGIEKGNIFYLTGRVKTKEGGIINVLVAIDTSFSSRLWHESIIHGIIVSGIGMAIMVFLGIVMSRMIRQEHLMLRRLADAEKLAAAGRLSAMLAHEIRNPLNTISMGLQYLKEIKGSKARIIERLQEQIQRLDVLTRELFEVTRGIQVNPARLQGSQVIKNIRGDFLSLVEAKGIEFKTALDGDFSFYADARWLMRALSNLVQNALEAVEGGGEVRLTCWQDRKNAETVFEVKDNGPGITREEIANITRPFYTTKKQGFGIGLYLAEMVAKAHNGRLVVKSKPGEGTKVTLILGEVLRGQSKREEQLSRK